MRLKASSDIRARAWAGSNRVQLQIGAFRFTATIEEAIELARDLVTAVDGLQEQGQRHDTTQDADDES